MLPRTYPDQTCSIARALEVVGERWTLLILRDALRGHRRFDEFRASLGIAPNVLSARLDHLVEEEILERRRYQQHPPRDEYRLTDKGRDLWPTTVALLNWGDRYYAAPEGCPAVLQHRGCGGSVDDRRICESCGEPLQLRDTVLVPGPGAAV